MKKKLYFVFLTFSLLFISACGNNFKTEFDVESGVYSVGKDIPNSGYTITCEETNYSMHVIVFESKANYDDYQNADRSTIGQESTAIDQNALYDFYLRAEETGYLGLEKGYVLSIESGNGKLKKIDANDPDSELYSGVYFAGNDLKASQYMLTCNDAAYSMQVMVFETVDSYKKYYQTSKFTTGEEIDAIGQNALYDYYISVGETGYIGLESGYVLLIDDGNGKLNELDIKNNNTSELYGGVYFVDNDLDANQYVLTCNEATFSMQVMVFESLDTYVNYHQTSRFTLGEESEAIEQNVLYDVYISPDEQCCLNLKDGYVLLIDSGKGTLNKLDTSNNDTKELYCGIYFVDSDIKADQYVLTCEEADYSMQVMIFESIDTYKNYHQTSRFTIGEENDAIEQNVLYDVYISPEEQCYLDLKDGYVVLTDSGKGTLNKLDAQTNKVYSGMYLVGDNLEAAKYSLKCIDSHMQITLFESIDKYKAYHQTSRFTIGEESYAIEQNAISSDYIYGDRTLDINLQEGNILLIDGGVGELTMIGK